MDTLDNGLLAAVHNDPPSPSHIPGWWFSPHHGKCYENLIFTVFDFVRVRVYPLTFEVQKDKRCNGYLVIQVQNPVDDSDTQALTPNSPEKVLAKGDIILAVNGTALIGISCEEAANVLKRIHMSTVVVTVRRSKRVVPPKIARQVSTEQLQNAQEEEPDYLQHNQTDGASSLLHSPEQQVASAIQRWWIGRMQPYAARAYENSYSPNTQPHVDALTRPFEMAWHNKEQDEMARGAFEPPQQEITAEVARAFEPPQQEEHAAREARPFEPSRQGAIHQHEPATQLPRHDRQRQENSSIHLEVRQHHVHQKQSFAQKAQGNSRTMESKRQQSSTNPSRQEVTKAIQYLQKAIQEEPKKKKKKETPKQDNDRAQGPMMNHSPVDRSENHNFVSQEDPVGTQAAEYRFPSAVLDKHKSLVDKILNQHQVMKQKSNNSNNQDCKDNAMETSTEMMEELPVQEGANVIQKSHSPVKEASTRRKSEELVAQDDVGVNRTTRPPVKENTNPTTRATVDEGGTGATRTTENVNKSQTTKPPVDETSKKAEEKLPLDNPNQNSSWGVKETSVQPMEATNPETSQESAANRMVKRDTQSSNLVSDGNNNNNGESRAESTQSDVVMVDITEEPKQDSRRPPVEVSVSSKENDAVMTDTAEESEKNSNLTPVDASISSKENDHERATDPTNSDVVVIDDTSELPTIATKARPTKMDGPAGVEPSQQNLESSRGPSSTVEKTKTSKSPPPPEIPVKMFPVVVEGDKDLVTDFLVTVFDQYRPCLSLDSPHAPIGLKCKHCSPYPDVGFRIFPSSRLGKAVNPLRQHLKECGMIPPETDSMLQSMEEEQTRQYAVRPPSGQAEFLMYVWNRLQACKPYLLEHRDDEAHIDTEASKHVPDSGQEKPQGGEKKPSSPTPYAKRPVPKHQLISSSVLEVEELDAGRMDHDEAPMASRKRQRHEEERTDTVETIPKRPFETANGIIVRKPKLTDSDRQPSKWVRDSDQSLVSEYMFALMSQFRPCHGPDGRGIVCVHCSKKEFSEPFYLSFASARRLASSVRKLHQHLIKNCNYAPQTLRRNLPILEEEQTREYSRLSVDGLGTFLDRLWERMWSMQLETVTTTQSSPSPTKKSRPSPTSASPKSKLLVRTQDKNLVSEYMYTLMSQVQPYVRAHDIRGIECIHCCASTVEPFQLPIASDRRLRNSPWSIKNHLMKDCPKVPTSLCKRLVELEELQTRQYLKIKPNDLASFFDELWKRFESFLTKQFESFTAEATLEPKSQVTNSESFNKSVEGEEALQENPKSSESFTAEATLEPKSQATNSESFSKNVEGEEALQENPKSSEQAESGLVSEPATQVSKEPQATLDASKNPSQDGETTQTEASKTTLVDTVEMDTASVPQDMGATVESNSDAKKDKEDSSKPQDDAAKDAPVEETSCRKLEFYV